MAKSIVSILIGLLASVCVSAQHWKSEVRVSSSLDRTLIEKAIEAWRPYSPVTISLVSEPCESCVTIIQGEIQSRKGSELAVEETEVNYSGDEITSVLIRVRPDVKGEKLEKYLEHEIGHALGLTQHRPDSVMSERWSGHHPREQDAALLRVIYGLPKYSFRRVVTKGNRQRISTFTLNDAGELVESDIRGDDLKVPNFPIGAHVSSAWWRNVRAYGVAWKEGASVIQDGTGDKNVWFPVEAWKDDIHIVFSDYQLFRTEVKITPVDNDPR